MAGRADITSGRLQAQEYVHDFDELVLPLHRSGALVEPDRCYLCYDAPCVEACPTRIDLATFIRKITTGNHQVCTDAMHYGFEIVGDVIDGLGNWMDKKGCRSLDDFRGRAAPNFDRPVLHRLRRLTMVEIDNGKPPPTRDRHLNNPMRQDATG